MLASFDNSVLSDREGIGVLMRAEHHRDRSEGHSESFTMLFSAHPVPMWIYDLETLAFLEVNDAAAARYGYTRDEFLRMRITDIRPEEDAARSLADAREPGPAIRHSGEWRHRLRDGRLIHVDLSSGALEFRGRRAALTVARDITGGKTAETEGRRFDDEIEQQRLRVFKATMTTVHHIVNNLLNNLQFVRLESEGRLSAETLTLFDGMMDDAALKLRMLADVPSVREKELAIGLGIEYPGTSPEHQ